MHYFELDTVDTAKYFGILVHKKTFMETTIIRYNYDIPLFDI